MKLCVLELLLLTSERLSSNTILLILFFIFAEHNYIRYLRAVPIEQKKIRQDLGDVL